MRILKFLVVAAVAWFLIVMGLSVVADSVGIPDTLAWMWIIRLAGLSMSICVAWVVVSASKATTVLLSTLQGITVVTNLMYFVCFLLGTVAVVMMFVKDSEWVANRVFHPFIAPIGSLCLFSLLPFSVFLIFFRKTRALGGVGIYFLSLFMGFELWFYSLMVARDHGIGWMIAGLLGIGFGVVPAAIIASAFWREWGLAGGILLTTVLVLGGRSLGLRIAIKQSEKDEAAEAALKVQELQVTALESEPIEFTEDEPV